MYVIIYFPSVYICTCMKKTVNKISIYPCPIIQFNPIQFNLFHEQNMYKSSNELVCTMNN